MNKTTVQKTLSRVNARQFTNQTQKVAFKLLKAAGEWVSIGDLGRVAGSPAARVRDLRKDQFGNFPVECRSAAELSRRGGNHKFFYRIPVGKLKKDQLTTLFRSSV